MSKKLVLFCSALILLCSTCAYSWTEYDRSTSFTGTVTVDDVTTRVRRIVDDEYSLYGSVRYSSATIYEMVNVAHKMFCISSQALTTWATGQLTASTTEYALPDNCLFIERVTLDKKDGNGAYYIPQKTVFDLDLDIKTWEIGRAHV